jgi:hypothetical protein
MATIEWFDSDEQHSDEIELLRLAGHKVNYHSHLTDEDIARSQTDGVDLIVTELYLDGNVFGGSNKLGIYLLEQVSVDGSANQDTPKLAYTMIINKPDIDKVKAIVGEGNYLMKPVGPERLVEKIESLL